MDIRRNTERRPEPKNMGKMKRSQRYVGHQAIDLRGFGV